jgi:hypothetical protein
MPEVIPHFVERANDIGTSDALQEFERSRTPNPQTPTSALSRWPNYSRNAYRLRDSGHNHQGVNSLAHSKSLLKQTG